MARVLLYTGKGGVGKTSMAAATALRCSRRGLRTIVLSTDPAHSLGDSFDMTLSPEPLSVAPNLWAQESDVYYNVEKYWGTVQRWIESVLIWEGMDMLMAEEMAVLPGMDEMASLLWILEHQRTGQYDVIIVDCAPTAETLRLLSFPEASHWWLEKVFPVGRRVSGVARPLVRRFTDLPLPGDDVFEATEQLFEQIDRIQAVLNNPSVTSVRLVINAEKMAIKEAQRTYTYLGLYGYLTDLVICNRLIPEGATGGYLDGWRDSQQRYLQLAEESFSPVPMRGVPFFDQEVVGLPMLERAAEELFSTEDPTQFFYRGKPFKVEKAGAEYLLELPVPLAEREELSLIEAGDELVIEVGRYRRNMLLPRMLVGLPVLGARLEDGRLRVRFGGGSDGDRGRETAGTGDARERPGA